MQQIAHCVTTVWKMALHADLPFYLLCYVLVLFICFVHHKRAFELYECPPIYFLLRGATVK